MVELTAGALALLVVAGLEADLLQVLGVDRRHLRRASARAAALLVSSTATSTLNLAA